MGDLRQILQHRPMPIDPPPQFVCPRCLWASWNPADRREAYCGHCRDFTGVREAPPGEHMSADQAAQLLAATGCGTPADVRTEPAARHRAWRAAVRKHHSNQDPLARELFRRIRAAKVLLDSLDDQEAK